MIEQAIVLVCVPVAAVALVAAWRDRRWRPHAAEWWERTYKPQPRHTIVMSPEALARLRVVIGDPQAELFGSWGGIPVVTSNLVDEHNPILVNTDLLDSLRVEPVGPMTFDVGSDLPRNKLVIQTEQRARIVGPHERYTDLSGT